MAPRAIVLSSGSSRRNASASSQANALTSLGKCFSPPGEKDRLLLTEHDGERAGTRVGGVQAGGGFELSREVRIESGRLHGEIEDVIAAVSLYAGSQYAGGSDTGLAAYAFLLEYGYPHTGLSQAYRQWRSR